MPFHVGPTSLSWLAEQVADTTTQTYLPLAEPYVDSRELPRRLVTAMAREGTFSLNLPENCGGRGLPYTSTISLHREHFGYASPVCDATYGLQTLGTGAIVHAGTPEQQDTYLSRLVDGSLVFAFGLTEPHSGSDVRSMRTRAVRDGGDWVLDGQKTFVSGTPDADAYVVFARSGEGANEVTAFIVERGTPGFTARGDLDVAARHPIGSLEFRSCRVSDAQRLGAAGQGLGASFGTLESFRPSVGAFAVGLARRAHDLAADFARGRRSFGARLVDLDAIRLLLGRTWAGVEAGRALVTHASSLRDDGHRGTVEVAVAKLYATEHANRACYDSQQIHGGRGVLVDALPLRLGKHARATSIYEGSSEIQRLIIGRAELGRASRRDAWAPPTARHLSQPVVDLVAWARRGYDGWLVAVAGRTTTSRGLAEQQAGDLCGRLLAAEATLGEHRPDDVAHGPAAAYLAAVAARSVMAALVDLPDTSGALLAEGRAALTSLGRNRDELALDVAAARLGER